MNGKVSLSLPASFMDIDISNNINVAPNDNTANSGITIPPVRIVKQYSK